jgi:hypothetical protein
VYGHRIDGREPIQGPEFGRRMSDTRLQFQIRARTADENLTLEELSRESADLSAALAALDRHISSRKTETVDFRVVDLGHQSPSAITIEAFARPDSLEDNSRRVIPLLFDAIESLNSGEGFSDLPRDVLEPIHRLAKSLAGEIKEIALECSSKRVLVTERIRETLDEFLQTEKIAIGSIRGTLDYINLHGGANTFRIYPIIGPSYVTCHFPPDLKEKAKQAIDRYISVSGDLHYRAGECDPSSIDAKNIEIMPPEEELPTLASLRGMIRLSEPKSAEELLAAERHGQWQ